MLIRIEDVITTTGWCVVLGSWRVSFRSYVEAEVFVERLRERIKAPHPLPEYSDPVEEEPL